MPNYELSKIYNITGTNTNGEILTYYGSTTNPYLSSRLAKHIQDFKNDVSISSREVLKCPDYRINLIELYPCKCKEELKARERFYSDNNKCVNINRPMLFAGEQQLITQKYYEKNKDQILEKHKEYKNKNKDKIKEQNKQYRNLHQEKNKVYDKQRYINNKEQKKAYNKQQYINKKNKKLELKLMSNEDINVM